MGKVIIKIRGGEIVGVYGSEEMKVVVYTEGNSMVSLTKRELEAINNCYIKDGKIDVVDVDKKEKLCIISVPVIDIEHNHKIITIPIDYIILYDLIGNDDDVNIYNVPDMLDDDDINEILKTIWGVTLRNLSVH